MTDPKASRASWVKKGLVWFVLVIVALTIFAFFAGERESTERAEQTAERQAQWDEIAEQAQAELTPEERAEIEASTEEAGHIEEAEEVEER